MNFTPTRTFGRAVATAACAIALATGTAAASHAAPVPDDGASSAAAASRPVLKLPFPCGQTWRGATYSYHKPVKAIDLNMGGGDDDLGKIVKSSGAGTVTAASYVGEGYGERIIISHGNGWSTLYAHLKRHSTTVSVGQSVTANTTIGRVGKTGGQATSHLHYEQRLNGNDVGIRFGTTSYVVYYSTDYYTRTRGC